MRKAFILLTSILSLSLFAQVNPEISVLFIGNSLTNGNSTNIDDPSTGNSMAYYFRELAEAAGYNVHVEMYAPNGKYIYDDPYNSSNIGHCNSSVTESYINSRDWDYVVVQDNVGSYMWAEGYINSDVGNSNIQLHDKIIANNPCTKEVFYAAQGYYNGLPSDYWHSGGLNLSYDDNIQATIRSYRNSLYLNDHGMHDIVTPVGLAWNRYCNDGHSKDDLYYDTAHPTAKASFLNGAVIFATIFKMDPSQVNYTGGYSDASYLKQIAWETVVDATYWSECNMPSITPDINVNDNVLSVTNTYNSYQWYEMPNQIQGANSQTYTINHDGVYFVEVTDNDGCKQRSKVDTYSYTTTSVNKISLSNNANIYPNPANNYFYVKTKTGESVSISDICGKNIMNIKANTNIIKVSTQNLNPGIYFVNTLNKTTKLIVE